MDDEPQRVAMTQREDFRPVSGAADERIVGRDGAVVAQAQDLAAQALGSCATLAILPPVDM